MKKKLYTIVFAKMFKLKILLKCGHLTLMDSTYNTNHLK